ncbi:MAG: PorT family protein [Prevotellaceae bacterium]|jgi:hypothetical protein|nr:PorT family protein [Prevotellaceae bacterium]
MKKTLYLTAMAIVLTTSYAQAQFKIGARAGFSLTNLLVATEGTKMRPGFQVGVVGDYALSNAFSLQSGILYAMQGCKYNAKEGSYMDYHTEMKGTYHLNYIQVPVHAQYKIGLGGIKLLFQAGPYLGYGLGGKVKIDVIVNGEKDDPINEKIKMGSGKDNPYKAFDFGLGFGAGLQFGNLQAALGYQFGLIDLVNAKYIEAQEVSIERNKIKNAALSLTLTYLFGK